ncbi:hypothetical protein ACGGAI_31190 [Streptomyces antibioticus]|uniref:hypothetical protein n=1 Tax=Streptomyces antibioticus TaxID=1890 RepID=UPI00371C28AA
MSERRVQFTVEARAVYDGLPGERRARLNKAVRILARDPFRKIATAPPARSWSSSCWRSATSSPT